VICIAVCHNTARAAGLGGVSLSRKVCNSMNFNGAGRLWYHTSTCVKNELDLASRGHRQSFARKNSPPDALIVRSDRACRG
jgi:hypothetical protein